MTIEEVKKHAAEGLEKSIRDVREAESKLEDAMAAFHYFRGRNELAQTLNPAPSDPPPNTPA